MFFKSLAPWIVCGLGWTCLWSGEGSLRWDALWEARLEEGAGSVSWLEGGTGRLATGANLGMEPSGHLRLSLDWEPSLYFRAFLHAAGRYENQARAGYAAGVAEAYVEASAYAKAVHTLRFRLGTFFPPTSMENVEAPWISPYSARLSTVNSWLAEEVRLTGLDLAHIYDISEHHSLFGGATVFGGNDTAGALLFWRGFTVGHRVTLIGEELALPPLASLAENGFFAVQRDGGSQPMGDDLDGRPGYFFRLGGESLGLGTLRLARLDNRGDRRLHGDQYAWETDYWTAGLETDFSSNWVLLGEYLTGSTGMGIPGRPHAQMDFETWYLLGSVQLGPWRFTSRYDAFETVDRDREAAPFNADLNDEKGRIWTLGLAWRPGGRWHVLLEWLDLDLERGVILSTGPSRTTGAASWTFSLRYRMNRSRP